MSKLTFELYETEDGECPFKDWVIQLPTKESAKLMAVINNIQEHGIPVALKMQWVKKLDEDIWEIRSQSFGNAQRACYFHLHGTKYIITHGFSKKTQKTPKKEIQRAHSIKNIIETQERKYNAHN